MFDVDKVVEQLEDEIQRSYVHFNGYKKELTLPRSYCDWFYCGLQRAVDIIKEEQDIGGD